MRELYLSNQNGERYYFSYQDHTLATNLDGLGVEREITYLKYDQVYQRVKEDNPRTTITMTLIFLNGYQGYSSFLAYLRRCKELRLYYRSDELRYCDVEIPTITKSELSSNTIQSSLTLDKLSLWQKDVEATITVEKIDNNKSYPFVYPYVYSQSFEGKVTVTNRSSEKAPMKIEIFGAVSNPEITILQDDRKISGLKLYVESENCHIIVDSNVKKQEMKMIENGEERDIYQYQDFTEENFLFLPQGSYIIEFRPGVSSLTSCRITFVEGYLGN